MEAVKRDEIVKFLLRRGWLDISLAAGSGVEHVPGEDEIAEVLDFFFTIHREERNISPTGIGAGIISSRKIYMISHKPLGWEEDRKEYYDTILQDVSGFRIIKQNILLREVGPDFSPDCETFEKLGILNRLCSRYQHAYMEAVPPDDREYFEWYLRIATSRIPRVEEQHFRNSRISDFCSFSVMKDFFRIAYLTCRDGLIMEEWERQKSQPPEKYHDRLFLETFTKLGLHNMVRMVLNDLWSRNENWALFRLMERLKKGFIQGPEGLRKLSLVEARLLSMGEKVTGEWDRKEMEELIRLSREKLPEILFED